MLQQVSTSDHNSSQVMICAILDQCQHADVAVCFSQTITLLQFVHMNHVQELLMSPTTTWHPTATDRVTPVQQHDHASSVTIDALHSTDM